MKYLILLSLFILAVGCDSPQRARNPINYVNGSSLGNTSATGGFSTVPTTGTTTGSTTGSTTTTSGFEKCDLSFVSTNYTVDMGYIAVCQSTLDETSIQFKPSLTSTSIRICLIPTYKDASGSSTWIGQPQCTYTTGNQIVTGKLYKDRPGYTSYPINGLIVMKEPLLPEYFSCMQAYTGWPANVCQTNAATQYCQYWGPRCPYGSQSNAACDTEGRNYMNQVCTTFKTKYANAYKDISLK